MCVCLHFTKAEHGWMKTEEICSVYEEVTTVTTCGELHSNKLVLLQYGMSLS